MINAEGQLLLIRNGESQAQAEDVIAGSKSFDVQLTELGLKQAEDLGRKIEEQPYHWVITSTLTTAKHTAEAILWHNWFEPEVVVENAQLDDRSFGTAERHYMVHMVEKYGQEHVDSWFKSLHNTPYGGETQFQCYQRVVSFFKDQIEPLLDDKNVMIVCHEWVLKGLVGYLEDLPLEKQMDLNFDNCKPIHYDFS